MRAILRCEQYLYEGHRGREDPPRVEPGVRGAPAIFFVSAEMLLSLNDVADAGKLARKAAEKAVPHSIFIASFTHGHKCFLN